MSLPFTAFRCGPALWKTQIRAFHSTPGLSTERTFSTPLNLPKWLQKNSHLLKPPINNYCVYDKELTVMVVGGPNARTDYHINSTPEIFYQYKGTMLLKTVSLDSSIPASSPSKFVDFPIHERELYVLPPNVPHNPVRFADTVGIVVEQKRPKGSVDWLRWYCQNCREKVYEESFYCEDLGTQIKDAVERFKQDTEKRKCKSCGEICKVVPDDLGH